MADLTQTVVDVNVAGDGTEVKLEVYATGGAITAGAPVYRDSSNLAYEALASGTAAQASAEAIALTSATANENVVVVEFGPMDIGANLVAGTLYYVSPNTGNICLESDLDMTNYVTPLGYASARRVLEVNPSPKGVTRSGTYEIDMSAVAFTLSGVAVTLTYSGA